MTQLDVPSYSSARRRPARSNSPRTKADSCCRTCLSRVKFYPRLLPMVDVLKPGRTHGGSGGKGARRSSGAPVLRPGGAGAVTKWQGRPQIKSLHTATRLPRRDLAGPRPATESCQASRSSRRSSRGRVRGGNRCRRQQAMAVVIALAAMPTPAIGAAKADSSILAKAFHPARGHRRGRARRRGHDRRTSKRPATPRTRPRPTARRWRPPVSSIYRTALGADFERLQPKLQWAQWGGLTTEQFTVRLREAA